MCRYYAEFVSASLFDHRIIKYWHLRLYLVLTKSFVNSEILLVVEVQLLYDVIHQVDYYTEQNRQIQANSDCQGHNGIDINRPVCVQVCILITFQKLHIWYEAGSRGSKQDTVFLLSVYTRLP